MGKLQFTGARPLAGASWSLWACAVLATVLVVWVTLAFPPGVAVVAAIILTLAATLSFKIAWAAFVLCFTFTGVAIPIGGAQVMPEIFGVAFLAIALAHVRSSRRGLGLLTFLSLAYLSTLIISGFLGAPSPLNSSWIALRIALAVLSGVAIVYFMPWRPSLIRVGTVVIGSVATVSIIGIILATLGVIPPGTMGVGSDYRLRGFSLESNIFAAQMVGWLAVSWASGVRQRGIYRFFNAIIVAAVVLAGTRSAWIAGLGLLAFAYWARFRESRWMLPAIACGILVTLMAPWIVSSLADGQPQDSFLWRLANLGNVEQGTGLYRAEITATALDESLEWPRVLLGTGANSYSQFHFIDSTGVAAEYLSNFIVATIYDSGVLGLALIAGLFICMVRVSQRKARTALVMATVVICSMATNVMWFQFAWCYIALAVIAPVKGGISKAPGALRGNDRPRVDVAPQASHQVPS